MIMGWPGGKKIKFARGMRLRGYFIWAVSGDKKWKISKQGVSFFFWIYLFTIYHFTFLGIKLYVCYDPNFVPVR